MLSERKRFNYMANSGHYNSAQKKNYNNVRATTSSLFHDQPNIQLPTPQQDKENQQTVKDTLKRTYFHCRFREELELINKKLVDETAKQFKKLEEDVQRVECILSEKELAAAEHKRENEKLREEVSMVSDEKKILIEAIFEKDIVIKEYENKLTEMLQENAKKAAEVPIKEELAEMN